MDTSRILIGLALGGLILTGCKKDQDKAVEKPAPAAPASDLLLNPATTGPSITVTPSAVPPTTSPSTSAPPSAQTSDPGAADADARTLLTEVSVEMADRKWDAASAALKKLNDMRPRLSQATKDEVTTAEHKYAAAKDAASVNLPGTATTQPTAAEPNK